MVTVVQSVFTVKSEFLPKERVYQMMPGEICSRDILNLAYWNTASQDSACAELSRFVEEYVVWRNSQEKLCKSLWNGDFQSAGNKVVERIDECISRLKQGIAVHQNKRLPCVGVCFDEPRYASSAG
jgi:hypothetical protein